MFRSYVLRDLVESAADFAVVIDSSPAAANNRTVRDFARCSRGDDRGLFGTPVLLTGIAGDSADEDEPAQGRWIGMLKVSRHGLTLLKAALSELRLRADFDALDLPALLNKLIADGTAIEVIYVHGHWRGVNDLEEFHRAADFAHAHPRSGSST